MPLTALSCRLRLAAVVAAAALCVVGALAAAGPAAAATHPYNKGCKALEEGDLVKATAFFKQAVKLEPEDTDALNNLAVCYLDAGDFAKATPLLEKVLRLNAKYSGADLNVGAGYILKGEPAGGEEATRKATDAPPGANGKIVEAAAYYNLGLIEAAAGDYAAAQSDLEQSASMTASVQTDVALGTVQCAQGDYDQGIQTLQGAADQQPEGDVGEAVTWNLAAAYYQRGMAKLEDGDVKGAEADFTASQDEEKNGYAQMGLALVAAEQGDTDAAATTLTELKDTAADPELAKAAAVNLTRVQDMGGAAEGAAGDASDWLSWLVLVGGGVLFAVQTYAVVRAAAVRPRGALAVPMAAVGAIAGIATAAVFALSFFGTLDNDLYVLVALGVDVVIVALTWAGPSLGRRQARAA